MRLVRLTLWLLLYVVVAAVLTTVLQVVALRFNNPQSTAWMRMRVRQARAEGRELLIRQTWVDFAQIPRAMKLAAVAAEDDGFYQHHGFDWKAIKKARAKNEKAGKVRRGGSTITQQLAKNLYLSPSRSYWRKAREAAITVLMEQLLSKDRILELYLNLIEFGPGVFGVEEAAKFHFRVSARQLSLDQAARLAAIIPSPRKWRVNGPYVSRRAGRIARIVGGAPKETLPEEPVMIPDAPEPVIVPDDPVIVPDKPPAPDSPRSTQAAKNKRIRR